jgi:hypothetical protein
MELQTLLALLLVAAAVLYVGRRAWRTLRAARATADDGCGSSCGCDSPGSSRRG